jgi:hypothetical protein
MLEIEHSPDGPDDKTGSSALTIDDPEFYSAAVMRL